MRRPSLAHSPNPPKRWRKVNGPHTPGPTPRRAIRRWRRSTAATPGICTLRGAGSRRTRRSRTPIRQIGPSFANESTPLMIGGMLYTSTSLSQVAAIDAASGETKWVFDPKDPRKRSRSSRQPWLAASRRRLLAQRRRRTHRDPHRVRADDRARRQDRKAGADVRHRWPASISPRACGGRSTATTTP